MTKSLPIMLFMLNCAIPASSPQYNWSDCDLNRDTYVDNIDFQILSECFQTGNLVADINGDGQVDPQDWYIFSPFFGQPDENGLREEILRCWAEIDRLEEDVSDYSNYILNMHERINHLFAPFEPNEVQMRVEDIR